MLVIRGDIKIRKMTRTAEVRVSNSDELDSFIEAEKEKKRDLRQNNEHISQFCGLWGRSIETYSMNYLDQAFWPFKDSTHQR